MPCPDCLSIEEEYRIFRKAFQRFADTLNQLEEERRRRQAENFPGCSPIVEMKQIVLTDDPD